MVMLAFLHEGRFSEWRLIYQGCRALTFALARLSCLTSNSDMSVCALNTALCLSGDAIALAYVNAF